MSDPRPVSSGVLELHPRGHGFLRNPAKHYAPTANGRKALLSMSGMFQGTRDDSRSIDDVAYGRS